VRRHVRSQSRQSPRDNPDERAATGVEADEKGRGGRYELPSPLPPVELDGNSPSELDAPSPSRLTR
jgi:hypothetical protein